MMRRVPMFTLGLTSALIILGWIVVPRPEQWVDSAYTNGVYRFVASKLIPISGALPVSIAGLAGLLGMGVLIVLLVVSWRRRFSIQTFTWRWLGRVIVVGLALSALFIVMWGANYGRTPMELRLELDTGRIETAEVAKLAHDLEVVVRRNVVAAPDWNSSLTAGKTSLLRVIATLEHRTVTLPRFVKRTPPGLLLFLGQATGIVSPWTLEAHIDGALPNAYALATALHEMTHLCGYGSEAETDFVAGVAGLTATDRYTRYSVALVLFARVARSLPPAEYRVRFAALPKQAKDDLQAFYDTYARFRPPQLAAYLQTRVYDSYLKTQGVEVGIADYDRVTDLLVAARRSGLLEFDGQAFSLRR